jgi:hypothetical protein
MGFHNNSFAYFVGAALLALAAFNFASTLSARTGQMGYGASVIIAGVAAYFLGSAIGAPMPFYFGFPFWLIGACMTAAGVREAARS